MGEVVPNVAVSFVHEVDSVILVLMLAPMRCYS